MDYSSQIAMLNSFNSTLPSIQAMFIALMALIGLVIFVRSLLQLSKNNRQNQASDNGVIGGLILGPAMWSLGGWLSIGSMTLFRNSATKQIYDTYEPLSGVDQTTAMLFAFVFYINFVGWILMGAALYKAYEGTRYTNERRWLLKSATMYLLAVFSTNFALFIDMVSLTFGTGTIGTDYLPAI